MWAPFNFIHDCIWHTQYFLYEDGVQPLPCKVFHKHAVKWSKTHMGYFLICIENDLWKHTYINYTNPLWGPIGAHYQFPILFLWYQIVYMSSKKTNEQVPTFQILEFMATNIIFQMVTEFVTQNIIKENVSTEMKNLILDPNSFYYNFGPSGPYLSSLCSPYLVQDSHAPPSFPFTFHLKSAEFVGP